MRVLLAAALATLVLVPFATGSQGSVSATATLARTGEFVWLSIRNTGTEPIKCWQFRPVEPVQVAAIAKPPTGWQLGAPGPPPQPVLGGRSEAGIPPGGFAQYAFKPDIPYPVNGGGELRVSTDCKTDVGLRVTGPPAPGSAPPKPKPKPQPKCKCESLDAEIRQVNRKVSGAQLLLDIHLDWTLTCTKGTGGCSGNLSVAPPRRFRFFVEDEVGEKCAGRCDKIREGTRLFTIASGILNAADDGVVLRVQLTCAGKKTERLYKVLFKRGTSVLDRKTSDLNGNRVPDGREKK